VVTGGPSGATEGVRIAASRAGQHNGEDDAQGHPADSSPGGGDRDRGARRSRAGRSRDDNGRGNRVAKDGAAKRSGRRVERATPEATRAVQRPPPASGPPRPRVSPARAKVLRQRRRRRGLIVLFTAFTAFCTFLTGVGYVYVQYKLDQIRRVELPALAGDSPNSIMNVLLVGSDSRANVSESDAAGFGRGQVSGQRSDTIMLLHVDPREQKAAIVSVPRDLYVPIADTGFSDRVNAAFALGGPDQLVATVQQALDITIHHYVQVDFSGFKDIVDTVGGVTMYVPYPVRDSGSGLDLGRAGGFELDGNMGLSWVRSRDMEFLINGTWQADGRGDLGRIQRQQDFIRRMMKKALSSGLTNPLQLNRLIGVAVRDVTFDSALSTKDLTELGRRFSSLDPDRVVLRTLPTDPADIDGKSVLKLQTAQAQPMIDLLNGEAPVEVAPPAPAPGGEATTTTGAPASGPSVKPSDVRVRVLNGIGTAGAAARAGTGLTTAGFVVTDRGDAPALAPRTTITYGPGQRAKAELVQNALLDPAVVQEDPTLRSVDVNLLLGADHKGVKPSVSAGTSVTAPATTTTTPQIDPVPLPQGTSAPPC
jgi:LCP family protein required for cell wall assembly